MQAKRIKDRFAFYIEGYIYGPRKMPGSQPA